ncbi:hypothetical protein JM93_01397 [Roseibium hamelinense]|uniref:Uncharacterized protein n=1 Tax=Roseibium hamelinense TaxID=150831 RepID=A0A562TBM6_9HYPH|nr:DUF6384 family protein [Roseibium hamelinense]MTI45220.1 hypothetical protein [Roseibium hamelinense]TWI90416.1 hypothetical protein JM93_01397 [Roseibium hamelinense]
MAEKADAPLDDLMMAMDVVDTLRHDEALVEKELGVEDRDARMIERLRQVYAAQGIDVPDHILKQGVEGLKEDRFTYTPPKKGISILLAKAYVTRMAWSKWLGAALVAVIVAVGAWEFLVVQPRERAAIALQQELQETIPAEISALKTRIADLTALPEALSQADRLADNGLTFASAGNAESARKALSDLRALAANLAAVFEVRIVSRPGTPTGVTRIPEVNPNAQNYYIVVEAVAPDGSVVPRKIVSEENAEAREVTIWGQRVPQGTFESVRRDKEEDGIVQDAVLGEKARGDLEIDWSMPVEEGAITQW